MLSLSGVALVIGASKGIGKQTALAFAAAGVSGLILASRSKELLDMVASEARALSPNSEFKVFPIVTDILSDESVRGLFKTVSKEFGRLDYAANIAGEIAGEFIPFAEASLEEADQKYRVNQRSTWIITQEEIKLMQKQDTDGAQRGSIVNVGSIVSVNTKANAGTYVPTKYAVEGITKTAAIDHARDGIRVNAVLPGYTMTEGVQAHPNAGPELIEYLQTRTPMGRIGKPEEISNVIVFLASNQASFVTGASWIVDGGFSIS